MTALPLALSVVDALPLAILVVDGAGRLVHANQVFWSNVGVEAVSFPPGTPFRDVVRMLALRGAYGHGDPDTQTEAEMALDRSRPFKRRLCLDDGAIWVEVVSAPLPEGGFVTLAHDITALHREAQEAMVHAQRLETVLNRLHGGVALYDPSRRLVLTNPAYGSLIGAGIGTIRPGMTHAEVIALQVARGEIPAHEAARGIAELEATQSQSFTHQRHRPNGDALRFDGQPMPEGGFMIEVQDISALKRAEDEARRRAALLDGVLAALPQGVCVYGPDRRVAMFNAAYERIMEGVPIAVGDRLEDVIRRSVELGEYTAEEGEATMRRHLGRPLPGDTSWRRRPNGTLVDRKVARLPDSGHVAVVTDITDLHQAQEDARRRSAMLEAMLGTIRHGIILYGPGQEVLAHNAKATELMGLTAAELAPGTKLSALLDLQAERGEFTAEQAEALKRVDRSRPHRACRTRRNGQVLEYDSDPTPDGGFVITFTDVTEDRRIRAELEQARIAAEAASQAKSRFLATMSHELRTPLNAVIGFAEALVGQRDPAMIDEYARAVRDAGRHLLLLIDDILDVARSQTDALQLADERVEPLALVEGAVRSMRNALAEAGLTLVREVPPDLPAIRGDARRLHQILLNLLSNAVKFTPSGGRVTLSAEISAEGLALRVADTGIGIPREQRGQVFEPFTQLDNSLARRFQGSGLGLYLARTLAEGLGGTLTLEEQAGPGTLVLLRFPPERLLPSMAAASLSPAEGTTP